MSEKLAFSFAGHDTRYTLPTMAFMTQAGTWSFSAWVKANGDPTASTNTLLEYTNGSTNRFGIKFNTGSAGGRIYGIRYNGSYSASQSKRGILNDGAWHHVVVVFVAGVFAIYVDGEEQTEASAGGSLGFARQIGFQESGSATSSHWQADTRLYSRALTAAEAKRIYKARTASKLVTDFVFRLDPEQITSGSLLDETGTYTATPVSYDRRIWTRWSDSGFDNAYGIQRLYAIGNSLLVDAQPNRLFPEFAQCINTGQSLAYHLANPTTSNYAGTYVWQDALARENYDCLMIQVFPESTIQTIDSDITRMQTWIDLQPDASVIVIYEGFPPSATVEAGTVYGAASNGSFAYSLAAMQEYVTKLRIAYPGRTILRSRTLEAVQAIYEDLQASADIPITEIGGAFNLTALYRDGLHLNYTHGRYLINACLRRLLGLPASRRFPFTNHPNYGSATPAMMDYMDSIVDRVFAVPSDHATPADIQSAKAEILSAIAAGNGIQVQVNNPAPINVTVGG